MRTERNDHLSESGCEYAKQSRIVRRNDDESYGEHLDLVDRLKDPLAQVFEVDPNMSFNELNKYADAIFAREFEGLSLGYEFTES
jgi:hypothetical protein